MERTLAENLLLSPKYNEKLIELYHPGKQELIHIFGDFNILKIG